MYEIRPDIEHVTEDDDKIRETLADALKKAWTRIDEDLMKNLIRSMKTRMC